MLVLRAQVGLSQLTASRLGSQGRRVKVATELGRRIDWFWMRFVCAHGQGLGLPPLDWLQAVLVSCLSGAAA